LHEETSIPPHIYKGRITKDTLEIFTGMGGGDCGYGFVVGQEYIVYGSRDAYFGSKRKNWPYTRARNRYWTNICTRIVIKNEEEIAEIEQFRKGKQVKRN